MPFSPWRARGNNDQLAFAQAARHFVQLQESSADSFNALAGIEKRVDAALEIVNDLRGIRQRRARLQIAQSN